MGQDSKKVKAKKSLGQHFLRSKGAVRKIVVAAEIMPRETVLEIGPGRGVLTEALLLAGACVVAVEKDSELIPELSEKFSQEVSAGRLTLLEGDILDERLQKKLFPILGGKTAKYKVVANIPYYITGALFRLFLEKLRQPTRLVFLVQKEVAEQIVSRNGKEGILSLSIKAFGTPKYVAKVPKESFSPKPKVDSAIIAVTDISRDRLKGVSEAQFFKVVKAGLGAKRKMLLGNLSKSLNIPKDELEKVFHKLDIPPTSRGEDLPIEKWLALAREINNEQKNNGTKKQNPA